MWIQIQKSPPARSKRTAPFSVTLLWSLHMNSRNASTHSVRSLGSPSLTRSQQSPSSLVLTSIGPTVAVLTGDIDSAISSTGSPSISHSRTKSSSSSRPASFGSKAEPSHPRVTVSPGTKTNSLPSLSKTPVAQLRPQRSKVRMPANVMPWRSARSRMSASLEEESKSSNRGR